MRYGRGGAILTPDPPRPEQLIPLICASIDSTTCGVCLLSLEETSSYSLDNTLTISTVNRPTKPGGKSRWKCRPRNQRDLSMGDAGGRAPAVSAGGLAQVRICRRCE